MSNINPYEILGVTKNFTLDELKNKYKRVAKKVHPDKGGSQQLFNLVTLAYKKLVEEYKLKNINKQFNELKTDFSNYSETQNNTQRRNTEFYKPQYKSNDFKEVFNKTYDNHKVHSAYDDGYGDFMIKSDGRREDIDIVKKVNNMKQFNSAFQAEPLNNYNKRMIIYKEPEALPSSSKSLKYTELGVGKVKDFSSSTNNLYCSDYKAAHSMNRLADPRMMNNRRNFNSVDDVQADRSNISYQLSEEDLRKQAIKQKKERIKEIRRQERQAQMDIQAQKNFERVNKLLLQFKKNI
jgi:curved DNA-binding protein CbpA